MLEPYVRPGIDDRPDLDKALSPEDKAAVARLAIKDRRRPPEASADQPEAQTVRLAAAGSSAAAAAAASVDTPAPDMSSAYLDMRDPMVAADGQRPTTGQVSRLNWGFFAASILVGAPWIALNTIAMPNAVARLFGYDTAALQVTINPATGRPLPVATDLAMPLAVLVIVGVVASMFAMPLISALSDRTRTPLGRRTPWMVAGGVLCALLTLLLGQNIGIVVLCIFWALMQFAYAMLSAPLASAISERVPDKFRPRIERWHGIGVMLGQALGVCMGAFGVMFDSFTPFTYTAVLFAVSGILSVLILPKEPSSIEQPRQLFNSDQVLDQLRPPAHAPAFARVFTARTCMMTGVGLTGVFLWYLVRFWVYGKAVVFTSAPLTLPAGFLIAGMAAATLVGAALASWAAGPISESIEEKNIPTTRVVAGACLLYAIGLGLAWGLGVWSTGTARENGMLLFALISGFAFGIYDSLGLELVMDSLPDPRRAGHDLGIYALANSAGLALAAIIGALLVNAFEHSFGYYLLFPSAIVMVLLAGIVTLTAESAQ
ncbi:sodium:solute symporter [Bifidobacterium longum]|uniref:Sodium:solute symporter n=2 Tax=Bifidobacterium longum TaxID=216816 RepID=A0A7U4KD98_BIFLN|nr:MFS transporter [Bifidobacterium longum]ADG99594.1 major facilitator superfamily MFS_1 [Bifidobacterium longum subsp. longum JDM301]AIF89703.1 sodium:solute symporter [Bifidobacterium longum]